MLRHTQSRRISCGPSNPESARPMPRKRARSAGPLTSARAGRMAMYSKNDSIPPGGSNATIVARIRSTSATEKLLSGKPEMIRS